MKLCKSGLGRGEYAAIWQMTPMSSIEYVKLAPLSEPCSLADS